MFIEPPFPTDSMHRQALQTMLDEVQAGKFTHVVVVNRDTLTTSVDEFAEIQALLEKHHTVLVLLEKPVD